MEAQRCRYLLEEPNKRNECRRSRERGAGNDALRRLFGRPYSILSFGLPEIFKISYVKSCNNKVECERGYTYKSRYFYSESTWVGT